MKITDKILSLPPYISTSWERVIALHMKGTELIITLKEAPAVSVDGLSPEVIEQIFSAHASFLEQEASRGVTPRRADIDVGPIRMAFGAIDAAHQMLQHNPMQRDLPPLPQEAVEKIGRLASMIPAEDIRAMPLPEEDCRCLYCQMAGILRGKLEMQELSLKHQEPNAQPDEEIKDEEIKDEELHFEQWDIQAVGEKLYLVTNKLEASEQYRVYLGNPIGCTCGKPNCEHLVAVLRH